ncbi:MAG TPA: hypothetical protein DFS52_23620 [Myxococcales bacterium]|jgi:hypothetical protein|nr:hypothetical protein [Myxococcales bacterium]
MSRKHLLVILLSSLLAVACSDEIEEICEAIEDCELGVDETQCINSVGIYAYSAECLEIMKAATCDAHRGMAYWDNCWEPCSGQTDPKCDGDFITVCDENGFKVTYDCERGCEASNLPYGGNCGTVSWDGRETSDHDVCWCVIYQ